MTPARPDKKSQQGRILNLLLEGLREGREIPLPEILALRIAMYTVRIKELRAQGWRIRNRMEMVKGSKHSWYWLESDSNVHVPIISPKPPGQAPSSQPALLEVPRTWQDPEVP